MDLVETARGEVIKRIRHPLARDGEFGPVTVSAEDNDSVGLRFTDEVEQTLPFMRQIRPGLVAGCFGNTLDAGDEQSDLGRFFQLLLEPGPLRLAQHRHIFIIVRVIDPADTLFAFFERTAEVARVEHDDLHPRALRTVDLRLVDAWSRSSRRVGRVTPEIDEDLLRLVAFFVVGSGVVESVVVVVPGRVDGAGLHQFSELRSRGEDVILRLHHCHVRGVGVDVVAEKQKEPGLVRENGFENGRGLRFLQA